MPPASHTTKRRVVTNDAGRSRTQDVKGAIMSIIRRSLVAGALVLCALVVLSQVKPTAATADLLWSDLPSDLVDSYGLTRGDIGEMSNGYLDGTWRPSEYVTRGQFVRLALGYFGIYPVNGGPYQHFSDVPRSSPHYSWVETALEIGLVSGYQAPSATERTVFGLYDFITREQAATILMRYLSKMEPSTLDYSTYTAERCNALLAPFSDKDQVRRAQEVAMALETNVLRPPGAAIMPQADLTRIQAAALIVRTRSLLPPPEPPPPPPPDTPIFATPLRLLMSEAYGAGIQVDSGMLGSAAPWMPRTLTLGARVQAEQDPAVYQEIAEKLVSLAEQYQDRMKYEQVRILLTIEGGLVVYDHTFEETTPTSTTTTT